MHKDEGRLVTNRPVGGGLVSNRPSCFFSNEVNWSLIASRETKDFEVAMILQRLS
jgi:hypothetical protein